mgnify:CR=1
MSSRDSYFLQDACINCAFSERITEYDNDDEFYCAEGKDTPPRPICGSVAMGECFDWDTASERSPKEFETWEKWKKGKLVQSHGKCVHYISKE